jgi:hypothetical protein
VRVDKEWVYLVLFGVYLGWMVYTFDGRVKLMVDGAVSRVRWEGYLAGLEGWRRELVNHTTILPVRFHVSPPTHGFWELCE